MHGLLVAFWSRNGERDTEGVSAAAAAPKISVHTVSNTVLKSILLLQIESNDKGLDTHGSTSQGFTDSDAILLCD